MNSTLSILIVTAMKLCAALSLCAIFALPCNAWGNLAHRTIALLAQKQFTNEASQFTRDLLGSETIDSAAIWADAYKQLPEGRHTGSWHFVDARDDPPGTCNVDYHRDCQPNRTCIIEAIRDTTKRMMNTTASAKERNMALKFVLHLIGDIHCPLHAESIARGGNDIPVLYRAEETNLHFIWDVSMPNDIANNSGEDEVEVAQRWAEQLYNSRSDTSSLPSLGLYRKKLREDVFLEDDLADYALGWARETNSFVCTVVLGEGADAVRNKELSGAYFNASTPVIKRQIALAGARLAIWINTLVDNARGEATQEREELR